jgi:uncharacterized membrane protein YfcA
MTPSILLIVSLVICGLLVGVMSGLVGVGGGLLIVPLLTLFYGFAQDKAGATSLAVLVFPVGILAVLTYHQAGKIEWPVALALAAGVVCGAPIGARLVTSGVVSQDALRIIFGTLLVYAAVVLINRALPFMHQVAIFAGSLALVATLSRIARLAGRRFNASPRLGPAWRAFTTRAAPPDYQI